MDPIDYSKQDDAREEEHNEDRDPDVENKTSVTEWEGNKRMRKKKKPPDRDKQDGEQTGGARTASLQLTSRRNQILLFLGWMFSTRLELPNLTWILHGLVVNRCRPTQTSVTRPTFASLFHERQKKKLVVKTSNPREVRRCFLGIRFVSPYGLLATHARLERIFQGLLQATTSAKVSELVGALGTTLLSRRSSRHLTTISMTELTSVECRLFFFGLPFTQSPHSCTPALDQRALELYTTARPVEYGFSAIALMVREDEALMWLVFFLMRNTSSSVTLSLEGQQSDARSYPVTWRLDKQLQGAVPRSANTDKRGSIDPIGRSGSFGYRDPCSSVPHGSSLPASETIMIMMGNEREFPCTSSRRKSLNYPSFPRALEVKPLSASGPNTMTRTGNILQSQNCGWPSEGKGFLNSHGCGERFINTQNAAGASHSTDSDGTLRDLQALGQAPNQNETCMASKSRVTNSSDDTTPTGSLLKAPVQCKEELDWASKLNARGVVSADHSNYSNGHGENTCKRGSMDPGSNFPALCEDDLYGNAEDKTAGARRADSSHAFSGHNEADKRQRSARRGLSIQCEDDLESGAVGHLKATRELGASSSGEGGVRRREVKKATINLHQAALVTQCEEDLQSEHLSQLRQDNRRLRQWFLCFKCRRFPWSVALIPCGHMLCSSCYGEQLACPICLSEVHLTSHVRLSH